MSIYTKNKTTVSNLSTTEIDKENAFKVGFAVGTENIVIDYLTNLYANPGKAVVRELFTNASDASKDNELPITIEFTKNENGSYSFRITDYGCGMSYDELKNNYITYTNSSKIDDFDTVGSFGLGSKSPMAISPSYTVESNNGKEQNIATVSRTKDGIFAKIDKSGNMEKYSFTSVFVNGISHNVICEMAKYTTRCLETFSKQPVRVKYTNFSNPYDKTNYEEIKLEDGITLYTNNPLKSLVHLNKVGVDNFIQLSRINNIVYSISSGINDDEYGYIVVDVEPGYFSFAPSREELPNGERRKHLVDVLNKLSINVNAFDFIKFMTENNYFSFEQAYNYILCRKDTCQPVDAKDYFIGATNKQLEKADLLISIKSNRFDAQKLDDNTKVLLYRAKKKYSSDHSFLLKKEEITFTKMIESLQGYCPISSKVKNEDLVVNGYKEMVTEINVIEDSKFTRKGEVPYPTEHKITAQRSEIRKQFKYIYSVGESTSYHNAYVNKIFIYKKPGSKIPESIIYYLNKFTNKTERVEDEDSYLFKMLKDEVRFEKFPIVNKVKEKVDRLTGREFQCEIYGDGYCDRLKNMVVGEDFEKQIKDIGITHFLQCGYNDLRSSALIFFKIVSDYTNYKVLVSYDKTRIMKNYFEGLGLERIDLEEDVEEDSVSRKLKDALLDSVADRELVDMSLEYVNSFGYNCYVYTDQCISLDDKFSDTIFDRMIKRNNGIKRLESYCNKPKKNVVSVISNSYSIRDMVSNLDQELADVVLKYFDTNKLFNDYKQKFIMAYVFEKFPALRSCYYVTSKIGTRYLSLDNIEKFARYLCKNEFNDFVKNIDLTELKNAIDSFKTVEKYSMIYSSLDKENDVDKIVIESFDSKVDDVVKAFKDLEL